MKNQILFTIVFTVFLSLFFTGITLPLISQENLLKNEFFEEWINEDNQPEHWTGSHSFNTNWYKNSEHVLTGNYSVEVRGGGTRTLRQVDIEEVEPDETYYAKVLVKGTGDIRVGITSPGGHTAYGDWVALDNDDWTELNYERTTPGTPGNQGGISIQTDEDGGQTPEETLYIGAAWIGTEEPSDGWPIFTVNFFVVGENGTIEASVDGEPISSGEKVEVGKDVVFTADPDEGFQVKEWTLNEEVVENHTAETFTVEGLDKNITVTVEFEEIPPDTYTVTFYIEDEDGNLIENAVVTFNGIENKPGDYVFENIEEGTYDYKVEKDGYYTAEDQVFVDDDITVEVKMNPVEAPTYKLTLIAEPEQGGSVEGSGEFEEGEEAPIVAEAAEDYNFSHWSGDKDYVDDPGSAETLVTMPGADVTLTANFDPIISVEDITVADVKVFPNPARDMFTVKANEMINQIRITDISGQVVMNLTVDKPHININVSNLQPGIYFMQIHTIKNIVTESVLITH